MIELDEEQHKGSYPYPVKCGLRLTKSVSLPVIYPESLVRLLLGVYDGPIAEIRVTECPHIVGARLVGRNDSMDDSQVLAVNSMINSRKILDILVISCNIYVKT
jgi:hypothetical protein